MNTPDPSGKVLIRFRPTSELSGYIRRGINTEDGQEVYPVEPGVARDLIRRYPDNWALEPGQAPRLNALLRGGSR